LRDLSAFANADGGLLVFGVEEERTADGKPTGIPKGIVGCQISNPDSTILSIEQMVKDGIDERLPALDIAHISYAVGNEIILIRIPASVRAPHMVTLGGDRRFYMRHNRGKQEMSTSEIRDAVNRTETFEERTLSFARDRVARCRQKGVKGPMLLMHVIPLSRNRSALDLTRPETTNRLIQIGGGHVNNFHHCNEGFKTYSENLGQRAHAITFRSGTVELMDQYPFRVHNGRPIFAFSAFDKNIFQTFEAVLGLYRDGLVQLPAVVSIGLYGVEGYGMPGERSIVQPRPPLEEDEIVTEPIILSALPDHPKAALRPALDAIWNAFGFPKCEGFDSAGRYVGYHGS